MAYTNMHIYIKFDGTQVDHNSEHPKDDDGKYLPSSYDETGQLKTIYYPELGTDIWVNIRNPMLMPQSFLVPKRKVAVDEEGRPLDVHKAFESTLEIVAALITGWSMYDVFDISDHPDQLPVPEQMKFDHDDDEKKSDAWVALMKKVPGPVTEAISGFITAARNPR